MSAFDIWGQGADSRSPRLAGAGRGLGGLHPSHSAPTRPRGLGANRSGPRSASCRPCEPGAGRMGFPGGQGREASPEPAQGQRGGGCRRAFIRLQPPLWWGRQALPRGPRAAPHQLTPGRQRAAECAGVEAGPGVSGAPPLSLFRVDVCAALRPPGTSSRPHPPRQTPASLSSLGPP